MGEERGGDGGGVHDSGVTDRMDDEERDNREEIEKGGEPQRDRLGNTEGAS
jgi:hypothetical protein